MEKYNVCEQSFQLNVTIFTSLLARWLRITGICQDDKAKIGFSSYLLISNDEHWPERFLVMWLSRERCVIHGATNEIPQLISRAARDPTFDRFIARSRHKRDFLDQP